MAISKHDQQVISYFPRPPPSRDGAGPTAPGPEHSPDPVYHASEFGFIRVGLDSDIDQDSLYDDDPIEDHRSNASQAPIPVSTPVSHRGDLRLVLDSPSRLFSPTETITGYISGWDPRSHVHIILEGRAKTYIKHDKMEYKDRTPLLYQITHLPPESQYISPRFSVPIPEKTQSGLERLDDFAPKEWRFANYWTHDSLWPARGSYECQPGHPLPPTTTMPSQACPKLLYKASGRGYISYSLIAVRSHPDATGKLIPDATCTLPIRLTTLRLPSEKVHSLASTTQTSTPRLSVQTTALSKDRKLSMYEHLKDAFNASAPIFHFSPAITLPTVSTPGSEIPIKIAIAVLPPPPGRSYTFPVPDVVVSSVSCRIRSYTGLRALDTFLAAPDKPVPDLAHTFKRTLVSSSKKPRDVVFRPRDGAFETQACVVKVAVPGNALPSFKTYGAWRAYRVEVGVRFRVQGRDVEVREVGDFNIVAGGSERGVGVGEGEEEVSEDAEDEERGSRMAEAIVELGSTGLDVYQAVMGLLGG